MPLRKAIDLTIAYPDATSDALDLQAYNGLSVKIGANAMTSGTAVLHLNGCDTADGTFKELTTDATTDVGFGKLTVIPEDQVASFPRYLTVSSDSTSTAAAGLGVTAYVNIS